MKETSWHLLRLGTWNLMDILPKPMMSNAFLWWIALFKDRAKTMLHQVCVTTKALFQTAHFCNKFQVKLFLFQWLGPVFLSSSLPKVGICSNRSKLHVTSFLWFVPFLWIIDKHCKKFIEPAANKYVGHTPAKYIRHYIPLDFCSSFLTAKF